MNSDTAKGRCLCGNVCFQVLAAPIWVGYCHCESCRRSTAAPVVAFVGVQSTDVSFTEGKRTFYESSPGVRRGFCCECGTPLTYEADRFPDYIQLHISTFDDPNRFSPTEHVHYSERISWFVPDDNLPRHTGSAIGESEEWPPPPPCWNRDLGDENELSDGL